MLVLKPGPRGGYPDALIGSSGTPQPFTAPERAAIDIPKHAAGQAPSAALPVMETATLSNGIKLVHYTMPEAPMVYVAASAAGGWNSVPEGKEGLLELAASMATRGAGDRGSADFAKAASDIGAGIGYQAGALTTMMTLGVPPEKLDQGLGLLADAVLKPRFDKTEWTVLMAQTVDWLNGREADLPGVAGRVAKAALIPQVPGKAAVDWSAKALASISLDEAKAAFKAEFTPKAVTFYSVGPMPVATVAASLEKAFGTWTSDAAGYAVEHVAGSAFQRRPEGAAGARTRRQPVGAVRGAAGARHRRRRARRIDRGRQSARRRFLQPAEFGDPRGEGLFLWRVELSDEPDEGRLGTGRGNHRRARQYRSGDHRNPQRICRPDHLAGGAGRGRPHGDGLSPGAGRIGRDLGRPVRLADCSGWQRLDAGGPAKPAWRRAPS